MKIKILTAFLALILLCGTLLFMQMRVPETLLQTPEAKQASGRNAMPFPDVSFPSQDGHTLNVNKMTEPIILVHFWAAWCTVCYSEFPYLLKYVASSHGKVALLSVALDDDYAASEKALKLIAAKNHIAMNAPHVYWTWDKDKSISLNIFNTVKVPETIIVNGERQMIDKIVGLGPWNEALTRQ